MPEKLVDCAFCNITTESDRIIEVGSYVTSFLSNPRLTKGHVLIVPNRHIFSYMDLCYEEMEEMGFEASRIGEILLESMADGIDTWTKFRPLVSENEIKVNHMHLHIVPSRQQDQIYTSGLLWTPDRFSGLSDDERDAMTALLRLSDEE